MSLAVDASLSRRESIRVLACSPGRVFLLWVSRALGWYDPFSNMVSKEIFPADTEKVS